MDSSRRRFLKGVGIAGGGGAIPDPLWTDTEAKDSGNAPQAVSGATKITLDVNDQRRTVEVEPRTTLMNALRNHLDPAVTGPKLVCDVGTSRFSSRSNHGRKLRFFFGRSRHSHSVTG